MIRRTAFILLLLFCLTNFGCFVHSTKVRELPKDFLTYEYQTNEGVKAHLYDGSLIIFPTGFRVTVNEEGKMLYAKSQAVMYDLLRSENTIPVSGVELSKVAALEIYPDHIDPDVLLASIPVGIVGTTVLGVIIFGSCPTYYTLAEEGHQLQGEGFSYSVSQLSEKEDVDKVIDPEIGENGSFQLILRNEAMETHYINKLSIWQVNHADNMLAFPIIKKGLAPKEKQEIMLMGKENLIEQVKNSAGEEIFSLLEHEGNGWYQSPLSMTESILENPKAKDFIEFSIPNPENHSNLFLGLKMRNTLLNSVFFYDVILDQQDFEAINWLTEESDKVLPMLKFRNFYKKYFGMTIEIYEKGDWKEIQYLPDQGPIAWSYRGFVIPTKNNKEVKVRLKFIPDNWMLDWLSASFEGQKAVSVNEIKAQNILPKKEYPNTSRIENLNASDKQYFITYPAQEFELNFQTQKSKAGAETTLFIYSEGYYIEWLRNSWLESEDVSQNDEKFELDNDLIMNLYEQWLVKKEQFETDFFNSKINPDN